MKETREQRYDRIQATENGRRHLTRFVPDKRRAALDARLRRHLNSVDAENLLSRD